MSLGSRNESINLMRSGLNHFAIYLFKPPFCWGTTWGRRTWSWRRGARWSCSTAGQSDRWWPFPGSEPKLQIPNPCLRKCVIVSRSLFVQKSWLSSVILCPRVENGNEMILLAQFVLFLNFSVKSYLRARESKRLIGAKSQTWLFEMVFEITRGANVGEADGHECKCRQGYHLLLHFSNFLQLLTFPPPVMSQLCFLQHGLTIFLRCLFPSLWCLQIHISLIALISSTLKHNALFSTLLFLLLTFFNYSTQGCPVGIQSTRDGQVTPVLFWWCPN